MNVIHVCETLPGGPATYLQEILEFQVKRVEIDKIVVVAPKIHSDMIPSFPGLYLRLFGGGRSRVMRTICLMWLLVLELFRGVGGVVHLHSTFAGFGGRLLYPFFSNKYKFIYCSHGWAWDRSSVVFVKNLITWCEIFLSKFCDKVVCISDHDYISGSDSGVSKDKLILVRNGVSDSVAVDLISPLNGSSGLSDIDDLSRRLLFVGRFDEQKGLDILIDAMKKLPEFRLRVIGSSVVDAPFDVDGIENVEFLGWRDRSFVRSEMRKCGMLVVPSRWEGFGLVAAEALAEGRPVVASAVGGLRDIVVDGVTGYLFSSESVDGLVYAVNKCSEQINLGGGFPLIRSVFREKFSSERMNNELLSVYLHC